MSPVADVMISKALEPRVHSTSVPEPNSCEPSEPKGDWKLGDRVLPILILFLCCYTRFWNIHLPSGIVFDELHFGKFVNWTLMHWMYFDIHPPFAKLTLAWLSHLWGYKAHLCDYEVSRTPPLPEHLLPQFD